MERVKKNILPLLIVVQIILCIVFSSKSVSSAKNAFLLWQNNIVPSLFIFFICIELLKKTSLLRLIGKIINPFMYKLFNVPGCGAFALILGVLSGYPAGAKIASDLYSEKLCTKSEAERLLSFTNCSGPLFIIGAVGTSMFQNEKIGFILLFTHFISAITVGLIFKNYKKTETLRFIISHNYSKTNTYERLTLSNLGISMSEAIKNSFGTLIIILGYMMFFALSSNTLGPFSGLFEITSGINNIVNMATISLELKIIISALLLGFGGISVHMQVLSIIQKSGLSIKPYLMRKSIACNYCHNIYIFIYKYNIKRCFII